MFRNPSPGILQELALHKPEILGDFMAFLAFFVLPRRLGCARMGLRGVQETSGDSIGAHDFGVSRVGGFEAQAQIRGVHWDTRKN